MDQIRGIAHGMTGFPGIEKQKGATGIGFADTLKALTKQVDAQLQEADRKAQEFAVGKQQNLHEVMIASEKAGLSFRFLLQIRNKLMEAYQEIIRMQF